MMNRLDMDQVRHIADLARTAADAHRRAIGGLQAIDLGDQPAERGSRNPTDLDSLALLDQMDPDGPIADLRQAIDTLPEEARLELKALMLVGRGDFAAGDWSDAMDEAARVPPASDTDYLAEKLQLHMYLSKGLYTLDPAPGS